MKALIELPIGRSTIPDLRSKIPEAARIALGVLGGSNKCEFDQTLNFAATRRTNNLSGRARVHRRVPVAGS